MTWRMLLPLDPDLKWDSGPSAPRKRKPVKGGHSLDDRNACRRKYSAAAIAAVRHWHEKDRMTTVDCMRRAHAEFGMHPAYTYQVLMYEIRLNG